MLNLPAGSKSSRHQPTLDYAPPPPPHRVRKWIKRITLTIFFLAAATFMVAWGRGVWFRATVIARQRELAEFRKSASMVVWSTTRPSDGSWVFLHRLVVPGHRERLVRLTAAAIDKNNACISWSTSPLRSIWDAAFPFSNELVTGYKSPLHIDRLFAGQPDPKDESHFTIAYELAGEKGVIDGWLMNDDTIKIEPRDGPLREGR